MRSVPPRNREPIHHPVTRSVYHPSLILSIQDGYVGSEVTGPVGRVEAAVEMDPGFRVDCGAGVGSRGDQDGVDLRLVGVVDFAVSIRD